VREVEKNARKQRPVRKAEPSQASIFRNTGRPFGTYVRYYEQSAHQGGGSAPPLDWRDEA
jgi:hypothetical protein